jgi:hypothetical protein
MLKDVRRIWASLAEELAPVAVEGRSAWILRRDLSSLERAHLDRRNVRLLPYFDSYLMGHKDREHLVKRSHHKKIYRPAGWVYPAVLVDGHVAGEWSHERKGSRLEVRVRPYEPLDAETKELIRDDAADVGRFLGDLKVRLRFAKAG